MVRGGSILVVRGGSWWFNCGGFVVVRSGSWWFFSKNLQKKVM